MKAATMKDCFGEVLAPGDSVIIVAPSAPMEQVFLHMGAEVVKRRGRRVVIRFPDSDYVKYNMCVLPDSIMKESSWHRERGYKPFVADGPIVCRACRNPGDGLVCLCG
jgi:hypothetical protein